MKLWLQEHLVCPECIESQTPLTLEIHEEKEGDIIEGTLVCQGCGSRYLIQEGVAVVVPKKTLPHTRGETGYNSRGMLSAYLWSHFSEFFNGPDATGAYGKWASFFQPTDGWALDIGCSVGRLSLELSKTHAGVVGVDTSFAFIQRARQLLFDRHLRFNMMVEGNISEERSCELDPAYKYDTTEFIVADALALPFRSDSFNTAASVNILEKVPSPVQHLKEVNRMLVSQGASFLFSDPFSWDKSVSNPDLWLGGRNNGPFKGRGMDNICGLLEGKAKVFYPGFSLTEKGEVLWKIRKTQNLWEHITSQFVMGTR